MPRLAAALSRLAPALCLAALAAFPAAAQIATSRPGFGSGPAVVPRGVFQLEAGTPEASLREGPDVLSFPVLVRLGLGGAWEVRAGTSVFDVVTGDGGDAEVGFERVTVGLKREFGVGPVGAALTPAVTVPTEGGPVTLGLTGVARFPLGGAWGFNAVSGLRYRDEDLTSLLVAVVDRPLGGAWSGYAELAAFPESDAAYAGGGLLYLLTPDAQVDLFFDAGLTAAAEDLVVGGGFSFRLD